MIIVRDELPSAPSAFMSEYESWIGERKDGFNNICGQLRKDLEYKYGESFQGMSHRIKRVDSAYLKICKGKARKFTDLKDLFGLKLIMLRRADVDEALNFLKSYANIELIDDVDFRRVEPSDFSYREPKVVAREARKDVLNRIPALRDMCIEIQITTSLQHALDISTHDFDYKGKSYSWQNFRKVARIRAIVESVELEIDRIADSEINREFDFGAVPERFEKLECLKEKLEVYLPNSFSPPGDIVRYLDIVQKWMILFDMSDNDLSRLTDEECKKILKLRSLTAMEKILGCFACIKKHNHDFWEDVFGKIDEERFYLPISRSLMEHVEYLRYVPEYHRADV